MHSAYKRSRRKIRIVGTAAIGVGVVGLVSPILPGLALIFVGFSVLSLQSNTPYTRIAAFRSRHPELSQYVQKLESWVFDLFNLTTHSRDYHTVPRRDGKTLSTLIEVSPTPAAGIAVLVHSASGTKETPFMNTCAEALRARGRTVIRFDAFDSMGESGGEFAACTGTGMYEDLGDVIAWARTQAWWHGELTLFGHSIGGLVVAHYAAHHPGEVAELILYAPMVSGDSYIRSYQSTDPDGYAKWRTEGERPVAHPLTGERFGFSYTFVKDACKYDLITEAAQLTMPTHILVGSRDRTAPESECRRLAEAIGPQADVTVIGDLSHTPKEGGDLAKLQAALTALHSTEQGAR
jgi:pimeloyl-ACP methyl ester carboxylesterase